MITLLSFAEFMEKIYSDTKTLSIIYIVGSILLFIFIVLLIISLRKPEKKSTKIIEEPFIDNNETKVEETIVINEVSNISSEDVKLEQDNIQEKDTEKEEENTETVNVPNDNIIINNDDGIVKETTETVTNVSSEIPDIDDYVDSIVNKTYEKNEQFSSVYVDTSTIKLEKVLDKLNVDDDIKEEIVPENEKVVKKDVVEEITEEQVIETENKLDNLNSVLEEKQINNLDKLENLKRSLEEKRNSVNDKQDELKNKLAALKKDTNKLDELKNKLDSLKNQ